MNNFLLSAAMLLISLKTVSAQDLIYKHDGSQLNATVNYMTESVVVYNLPGETKLVKLGKAEVEKVVYKSGRVEVVSEKIVVKGNNGWEKIIISTNPLAVVGLVKKGEIKVKYASREYGAANFDEGEIKRIKKQAASLGAHIVVVTGYDGRIASSKDKRTEVAAVYGY